jgi:hypothetical protein
MMTFSSADPCGGLSDRNLMNVRNKLRRQKVFPRQFQPHFHGKNMQKIFKTLMNMPDELLSPYEKLKRELSTGKAGANRNSSQVSTSKHPRIKVLQENIHEATQFTKEYTLMRNVCKNVKRLENNSQPQQSPADRTKFISFINETRQRFMPKEHMDNFIP